MATQTAKSKLPDVQAFKQRKSIPNSQPLESQTDHQRDSPITGQAPYTTSRELSRGLGLRAIAPNKPAPRRLRGPSAAVVPAVLTTSSGPMWILPWHSMEPRADCRQGGGQP